MILIKYMEIPEECSFEAVAGTLPLVSLDRQEMIRKYRQETAKLTALFAELLLRATLISQSPGLKNDQIEIQKTEKGKPFLVRPGKGEVFFSWSHSLRYIALALARTPVGIDLERIRASFSDKLSLAKRFFLPEEYAYIICSENQDEAFYTIWTRKEALIKKTGEGLSRDMRSFSVLGLEERRDYNDRHQPWDSGIATGPIERRGEFLSFRKGPVMISVCADGLAFRRESEEGESGEIGRQLSRGESRLKGVQIESVDYRDLLNEEIYRIM